MKKVKKTHFLLSLLMSIGLISYSVSAENEYFENRSFLATVLIQEDRVTDKFGVTRVENKIYDTIVYQNSFSLNAESCDTTTTNIDKANEKTRLTCVFTYKTW